jgi:DNA-binding transcriptional LysR family regulator
LELLQLKYFMTVANLQSITKASNHLQVSQPSVSQAISRLEGELGVLLFDRVGKTIRLNTHGRIMLNGVNEMFRNIEQSIQELQLFKSTTIHPLHLKIWPRSTLCSKLLVKFADRYPYINLQVTQSFENEDDGYDIKLFIGGYDAPPLQPSELLLQEEILLAVPLSHPLAQYESIPLFKAKDESFIMLSRGSPLRELTDSFCKQAGFTPRVVFENDCSGTLFRMLRLGVGVGFVTSQTGESGETAHFKTLHIETPLCIRTIYITWTKDGEMSQSAVLFYEVAKQYFRSICSSPRGINIT